MVIVIIDQGLKVANFYLFETAITLYKRVELKMGVVLRRVILKEHLDGLIAFEVI